MSNINIYTDVYSDKAFDILTRLRDFILQRKHTHWQDVIDFTLAEPKIIANREVVWSIETEITNNIRLNKGFASYCKFNESTYNKLGSDYKKIREWLADSLKRYTCNIINYECLKNETSIQCKNNINVYWNRSNHIILKKFSEPYINIKGKETRNLTGEITISDIFCLYDILQNNIDLSNFYSEYQLLKIIGNKLDPVAIEFELYKQNKIKEIITEHNKIITQLKFKQNDAIRTATCKINNEYNILINNEEDRFLKECEKHNVLLDLNNNPC